MDNQMTGHKNRKSNFLYIEYNFLDFIFSFSLFVGGSRWVWPPPLASALLAEV